MELLLLLFPIALAILVPIIGIDSRDGRDWQPRGESNWPWR
jgi:hypothetical protein